MSSYYSDVQDTFKSILMIQDKDDLDSLHLKPVFTYIHMTMMYRRNNIIISCAV